MSTLRRRAALLKEIEAVLLPGPPEANRAAPAAEARPEQTGKRCAYGMTRQEHFTPGQRAGKGEK